MSDEKIFVGIDNERIELIGDAKKAFLADRQNYANFMAQIEAEKIAKAQTKAALLDRLGITAEEAASLLA